MKKLVGLALLCLCAHALALPVAGVALNDKVRIGNSDLILNGAGLRTKLVFNVYVGALYLGKKTSTAQEALADKGAKRIELHLLRHISAGDFMDAFNKAINANNTPEEYAPVAARLIHFGRVFREVGEVDKGSVITIDYLPEIDTTVIVVAGKERARIEGADFYAAMLKMWLGKNPVQDSLKKAMLGG